MRELIKPEERILCSAIWLKYEPTPTYTVKNVCGLVITGHRHPHCISIINSVLGKKLPGMKYEQGFLTSENRFVSRTEAGQIAFKAGQTKKLCQTLFSEDIY